MAEERKKKHLSEDQWANLIAQGFALPEPDGEVRYSLAWENATACFWKYEAGCWRVVDQLTLMGKVRARIVLSEPFTMARGRDVVAQMPFEVQRYDVIDDGWLAFRDGSWFPDTGEFAPHAPSRFATASVDADFGNLPAWRGTRFAAFLDEVCVHQDGTANADMALLLQEMFGYCLLSSSARAVSFFLSGEGRNGKGVLLDLLRHMLNADRVSQMSLSELTASRFATSALVGKLLNIADETNTSREAVSDLFKKLVAVDTIDAERKFGEKFRFKPRCKHIFNVNGVPTFDGFGPAMRERIITVPFYRQFSKEERDYDLGKKLLAEMPSVIAWAMEGLRRLKSRNLIFTEYAASTEMLDSFEHLSDPFAEFASGWERHADPFPFKDFYREYAEWCEANGRHKASSKKIALRVAARAGRSVPIWDPRSGNSVAGVCLRRRPEALPPGAVVQPVLPTGEADRMASDFGGRVVNDE